MKASQAAAAIPYARFLDVRVEDTGSGLVCVMPFRADLVGNIVLPAVHGGVVGAFLELTALLQLVEVVDSDRVARPINFSIDYLRSAGPRDTRGRAEIVKHGRRIANVRVIAWQDDPSKPVASGTGNFLL
ncbi:MAG TPA: PaaI family thioesterase [Candidatus Limnocylindrales bacterium]|nr:PaaI family thioesterase [Candidatus Limnocylindrales bacterium]